MGGAQKRDKDKGERDGVQRRERGVRGREDDSCVCAPRLPSLPVITLRYILNSLLLVFKKQEREFEKELRLQREKQRETFRL